MAAGVLTQFFFIPTAPITEKDCPDQTGRVFIVTGGYSGVGLELCKILYAHNATIYIAGRSPSEASNAISDIKKASPQSSGRLDFLLVDLSDFSTIKSGVDTFLAQESRLDILVNNAGVMLKGSSEARFNEVQITTNCVGPCLLFKLLIPILCQTAASSPTGSVRVLWAGSVAVHTNSPQPSGMVVDDAGRPKDTDVLSSYAQSKVGNVFLAREYAKKTPQTGIVHASFNPGNLRSGLQRHWGGITILLMKKLLFFPAIYGAYTQLWAALSPDFMPAHSGSYVYPWGRFGSVPVGIEASMKAPFEGGTSLASQFLSWCEKQTESYI